MAGNFYLILLGDMFFRSEAKRSEDPHKGMYQGNVYRQDFRARLLPLVPKVRFLLGT